MTAAISYCGQQVRRFDPDRFLTCLFAPAEKRESLFALYAFNLEIAKTREMVHEKMIGEIRLQWWREAIADLYRGQIRAHEVLQGLAQVEFPRHVDETLVQELIDARELDLEDEPPATGLILEQYTRATGGGLMEMAARLLGVSEKALLEAAQDLGEGVALTGLLRAVPFHNAQHKVYLPADLMRQMGVDPFRPDSGGQFGVDVVAMLIAKEARRLLDAWREPVPRPFIAAYLPARLARIYLRRLARAGHDVFDPAIGMACAYGPFTLARAWVMCAP